MANNNNKTIYIIIGGAILVTAIPVVIAMLGILGGFFYLWKGAN